MWFGSELMLNIFLVSARKTLVNKHIVDKNIYTEHLILLDNEVGSERVFTL